MEKQIILTEKELEQILRQSFIHGQGNKEMMEAGLERDETEDYVLYVKNRIIKEYGK